MNKIKPFIWIAFSIFVIWGGCKACKEDKVEQARPKTRSERIEQLFSAYDGSQPAVESWIKDNIKDPNSYKHLSTKYIDQDSIISIITEFTGTNSFGANIKTACIAKIDTSGNLISSELIE